MSALELKVEAKKDDKTLTELAESTEKVTEEKIDFKSEGEATTSLADLLKKAGF